MNATDFPPIPMAEALERLAAMPDFLDESLAGLDQAALRTRIPAGGDFSLVEHACHLNDLEREGYLVRVQRMLMEEMPELPGFAGDVVARERDYLSKDAHAAAADFRAARLQLLARLWEVEPAQLCRKARFDGREITLGELVAMIAGHDAGHRAEIEALREALARP